MSEGDETRQRPQAEEEARDRRGEGLGDNIKGVSDAFRKAVASGLRSVTSAEALPRELLNYAKRQIDTGRDEVVRVASYQFRRFLDNVDVGGEMKKVLTALSFEVRTTVRFVPTDEKLKPQTKTQVRVKRGDETEELRPSREKLKAVRSRVMGAMDSVLNAFQRGEDEDYDEDEHEGRLSSLGSLREGLVAAVDTVLGTLQGDEEEEEAVEEEPAAGEEEETSEG